MGNGGVLAYSKRIGTGALLQLRNRPHAERRDGEAEKDLRA